MLSLFYTHWQSFTGMTFKNCIFWVCKCLYWAQEVYIPNLFPWKFLQAVIWWKRLWCWEGLGAGGEGNDRGWDGWMTSLTGWTWVWVNSGSWWWTGRPGVLQFTGSQRVGHDWATELNWTVIWWAYDSFSCFVPNAT